MLSDIDKFVKGIMPEESKNFRFIDFLIVAEAWSKVSKILLSSSRDASKILDHLKLAEQIPMNLESKVNMLGGIVRRNLISASEVLPNFEQLRKYEIKDILNEDGEISEENLEINENSLQKLKNA